MNFGKVNTIRDLPTAENILERVSESEIFKMYLGTESLEVMKSPLRNDKHASFSLFYSKQYNKIFFKDFATGESGDCFLFVMRKFNFSRKIEAYNRIAKDFLMNDLEIGDVSPILLNAPAIKRKSNVFDKVSVKRSDVKVKIRPWNSNDMLYWRDKYNLAKNQLEYCNVYPISHFFINGICFKAEKIAYAFVEEKDGRQTFKVYQPFAVNSKKWINNNDYSTWELWTQLPKEGENLIITSSRKDAMVIKSLFNSSNITSCSLQSEGVMPKESVVNELKSRFKNIFVLYDNDYNKDPNRGRIHGAKIEKNTGFKQIEIPSKYSAKDPSDFICVYGRSELTELIKQLIQKK